MQFKHLCIGMIVLLSGCASAGNEWQKAASQVIRPGSTVQIRVAHAANNRLKRMTAEQLRILLSVAKFTVQKNFGVNVEFTDIEEISVEHLFAHIPPRVMALSSPAIYDFKSGAGDRYKLAEGLFQTLTQRGTKLEDAVKFVAPFLPAAHPRDLREFSSLLTEVMLSRLEDWRGINAADGMPVLDASPFNEWVYWDAAGYGNLPYELVITNQLIASAEYVDVDIHSALRGGVSVGTTTYSRGSKFGAYIFWSTFPFQDASEYTRKLRGGEVYSPEEAAELSGIYLAHEIGHLLFQFGHPFGKNSCLMNPVSMLRFREWSRQINGAECAIGSSPEMSTGAVPFYFNPDWVKASRTQ
jgi:hypothetical protein